MAKGEVISYIDTHAHLDDKRFDEDREVVIASALESGVGEMITVGCWSKGNPASIDDAVAIAGDNDSIYNAIGIHPHDAKGAVVDVCTTPEGLPILDEAPFDLLRTQATAEWSKVVAIGEAGLDYFYDNSPREAQKAVFIGQIALARELGLPIIIHSRDADEDTIEIFRDHGANKVEGLCKLKGVIHCFSGTLETAKEALDLGLYLSFTGVITFKNAEALREVVSHVPIERILIETDCPYLAPVPHRGKRNEPAFVVEVGRMIGEIKGLSEADVARITTRNARELFKLPGVDLGTRIAYPIRSSLYLNITNSCTNHCTFCPKFHSYVVKGHNLELDREPTFEEVIEAVGDDISTYDEIVFCGFGEPTLRLDLVSRVGRYFKDKGMKIRIDTDGMANLVYGRDITPELDFVDAISVSLNAPDSATFQKIIKTPYGDEAWKGICDFILKAKEVVPEVTASVVSMPGVDLEESRMVVEGLGVKFRVRTYNEVG